MNETIIIRAPIGASWESREVALTIARRFCVDGTDRKPGVPMPYGTDGDHVTHVAHWTKRRAIVVTVLEVER